MDITNLRVYSTFCFGNADFPGITKLALFKSKFLLQLEFWIRSYERILTKILWFDFSLCFLPFIPSTDMAAKPAHTRNRIPNLEAEVGFLAWKMRHIKIEHFCLSSCLMYLACYRVLKWHFPVSSSTDAHISSDLTSRTYPYFIRGPCNFLY